MGQMVASRFAERLARSPGCRACLFLAVWLGGLLLVGTLSWLAHRHLVEQERRKVLLEMQARGLALSTAIEERLALLTALRAFVLSESTDEDFATRFKPFARGLVLADPRIRNVALSPGAVIRWVYPERENQAVVGLDLMKDPRPPVAADVRRSLETRQMTLSEPYELIQGGRGLVARIPVFQGETFWGFCSLVMDFTALMRAVGLEPGPPGLLLTLRGQDETVLLGPAMLTGRPVVLPLRVGDRLWQLSAVPVAGWQHGLVVPLTTFTIAGLALVALLALTLQRLLDHQAVLRESVHEQGTALRHREDELREVNRQLTNQSQLLDAILRSLPAGVAFARPDGHITLTNTVFDELIGQMQQTADGKQDYAAYEGRRPDGTIYQPLDWPLQRAVRRGERVVGEEIHFRCADGQWRWLQANAQAVRDSHGQALGGVCTLLDVTERKQSAEALADHARRLEVMHELDMAILRPLSLGELANALFARLRQALPDHRALLLRFDHGAQTCQALAASHNGVPQALPASLPLPAGLTAAGIAQAQPDLAGSWWRTLAVVPPVAAAARVDLAMFSSETLLGSLHLWAEREPFSPIQRDLAGDLVRQFAVLAWHEREQDLLRQQTDALRQHLDNALPPVPEPETAEPAKPSGAPLSTSTISRRVRAATHELEQANALLLAELAARQKVESALAESNHALEAFAYSVSHDLRAPLRAMDGFAQALLEDYAQQLDATGRDYAQRIVAAAGRMDRLIGDLLAYSRLSRDAITLTSVSLESTVRLVLEQMAPQLSQAQAQVSVASPLPSVLGQPVVLEQVLTNLLGNAIKFVAPGTAPQVTIRHECRQDASGSALIRLWICDNGIGIPAAHHERIFKVFERLHGQEAYPGTGIGLAIVQRGIARLGGTMGLHSAPGEGSQFWLELPAAPEANSP